MKLTKHGGLVPLSLLDRLFAVFSASCMGVVSIFRKATFDAMSVIDTATLEATMPTSLEKFSFSQHSLGDAVSLIVLPYLS